MHSKKGSAEMCSVSSLKMVHAHLSPAKQKNQSVVWRVVKAIHAQNRNVLNTRSGKPEWTGGNNCVAAT